MTGVTLQVVVSPDAGRTTRGKKMYFKCGVIEFVPYRSRACLVTSPWISKDFMLNLPRQMVTRVILLHITILFYCTSPPGHSRVCFHDRANTLSDKSTTSFTN
jgi:hypothetical protein